MGDIGKMTDNPTDQEKGQPDILLRWAKRRQTKGTRMSHIWTQNRFGESKQVYVWVYGHLSSSYQSIDFLSFFHSLAQSFSVVLLLSLVINKKSSFPKRSHLCSLTRPPCDWEPKRRPALLKDRDSAPCLGHAKSHQIATKNYDKWSKATQKVH